MVKILLSCDADDYEVALTLKSTFQESFGFKVFLEVDDWKVVPAEQDEDERQQSELAFEYDLDSKLEGAAVLLILEFGEKSSISAWVMLEPTDKRNTRNCNPRKSFFPESIDFGKSFSRGIRIFENILKTDFGYDTSRSFSSSSSRHYTQ